MPINASLFAHIQNDAFLAGTVALEGNYYSQTVPYLHQYLQRTQLNYNPEYRALIDELNYLMGIEQTIRHASTASSSTLEVLNQLAEKIMHDLEQLPAKKNLLIPGGWVTKTDGHAMIYQLNKKEGYYEFTVFNSGDGIRYHGKRSSKDKELYNPIKTWSIPSPLSENARKELVKFLVRLLKAQLLSTQKKVMSSEVLYKEILPTISYVDANELDASEYCPLFAYTGGQLSATCTQRILHQMLKIKSSSLIEYRRFIFNFKMHALVEYSALCSRGVEPFNSAVAEQISVAIENNLKILNIEGLFNSTEQQSYLITLEQIQTQVRQGVAPQQPSIKEQTPYPQPHCMTSRSLAPRILPAIPHYAIPDPVDIRFTDHEFIAQLSQYIAAIKSLEDPALCYLYLEQLMLNLPLSMSGLYNISPYKELLSKEAYAAFYKEIEHIQVIIHKLQTTWAGPYMNKLNVLSINALSLQTDIYNLIKKIEDIPAYKPFTDLVLNSLLANQKRNPFWATNHPLFDQRFLDLQKRYEGSAVVDRQGYIDYFKRLLETEPALNAQLLERYNQHYATNTDPVHKDIRKNNVQALYLIAQNLDLPSIYTPLVKKVNDLIAYEVSIRRYINPLLKTQYREEPYLNIIIAYNEFRISTTLYPTFIPYEQFSSSRTKHKYDLAIPSAAKQALEHDCPESSTYIHPIKSRTSNHIQLHAVGATPKVPMYRSITQEDIVARDYFHLRINPKLQIPLTLDYFKRGINKLVDDSNKRYLEANLFQPGLLKEALKKDQFIPQFDGFLTIGLRLFAKNNQHNKHSLLFLRLNFLVSSFMALSGYPAGEARLIKLQLELRKQLQVIQDPGIKYCLYQYLFLTTIKKIESAQIMHLADLELALETYVFIQKHANPLLLEDSNHRNEIEIAIARLQTLLAKQSDRDMLPLIKRILWNLDAPKLSHLHLKGQYPVYSLCDYNYQEIYQFHVLQGKLFQNNLSFSNLPLVITNHPLIQHLSLGHIKNCLMSCDETYMILPNPPHDTQLFYHNDNLTIVQNWTINHSTARYELQALTKDHLAAHANKKLNTVDHGLPLALKDKSVDYWVRQDNPLEGIIVKNSVPLYLVKQGAIILLDAHGRLTTTTLVPLADPWAQILTQFEDPEFLLHHYSPEQSYIDLPRFNLRFNLNGNLLINAETGEQIDPRPSPIHHQVAGLVLAKEKHERYLIPITQFYAQSESALASDFYPLVHDISGRIQREGLLKKWQEGGAPAIKPLWDYQNGESYASFLLKDGKPIADSPADALYLAYVYLATNQTQKAWETLEDCTTRLGGLTGSNEEVKYLMWIHNALPHILPDDEGKLNPAKRNTPPYVACKLTALSMLTDYLNQDHKIHPSALKETQSANYFYEQLEQHHINRFLTDLPHTVYLSFSRYQAMRRHLEGTYHLTTAERKSLLTYYKQEQKDTRALGALGYEWTQISLEQLQAEEEALNALKITGTFSVADEARLHEIEQRFKTLKPVLAHSTELQLAPIDLKIPDACSINQTLLNPATIEKLNSWFYKLPSDEINAHDLESALNALSSDLSEPDWILNFPAYLQIALGDNLISRKTLGDFCKQTLLATRHIPLSIQQSNKSLLCNVLYRVLNNTKKANALHRPFYFETLVAHTRLYEVAPLSVYEAVNVYKDILAKPEEILAQQIRRSTITPQPLKTRTTSLATAVHDFSLTQFIEQYSELSRQYEESNAALTKLLTEEQSDYNQLEIAAGKKQLDLELAHIALAKQLMTNRAAMSALEGLIHYEKPLAQSQLDALWSKALKLANRGPSASILAKQWRIERAAKSRPMLSSKDLCSLYIKADLSYTAEKTGLALIEAQSLHEQIHNAFVAGIKQTALNKIKEAFEKATRSQNPIDLIPALEFLAKKEIPALTEPAIIVLQHEEEIVLRPRQISALQTLLEKPDHGKPFRESVEKIIPGGGKSKVILPILAEQKATGSNLVIVEVPQALLATNHVDLNRVSQRLFGKSAYRFEFTRESNSSPQHLEQLYNKFTDIMANRGYLVTTGESIQSLELKYLELLLDTAKQDSEWEQQVYWCDKIVTLIHQHGDAVIDEVHQGLWIKKKLNYTIGTSKPLPTPTIQNAVALYRYISDELIKEAPTYSEEYNWLPFKKELAEKLIRDKNSPLSIFVTSSIKRHGPEVSQELIDYLLNTAAAPCTAIAQASTETKSTLAFFKQQITVLLPQTLTRRLSEKYGESKRPNLTSIERTLAIPYAANNIPNERSRFGNTLEAINYTCQMMLLTGIPKSLLKEQISLWHALARQELFKNQNLHSLDETPTARGIALQWPKLGYSLSEIDLDDEQQLTKIHSIVEHDRELVFNLLEKQSLRLINKDKGIIHSDSFNHVDSYRTVQAVSGTPSNHTTFHQRLEYDRASSLGTDGYIIQLLDAKDSQIRHLDYDSPEQYIKALLAPSATSDRCRAIIDIRAAFQGVSNIKVAQLIASHIKTAIRSPIKHVLYFNSEQVLCAIDINKPQAPIILKTSDTDEINRILGSAPNERFTYYDQVRTLGTDITQDDNAHALVLVDQKTSLQAFLQGSMRMRGLRQNQTIEIVAEQQLKTLSRNQLILQFEKTDHRILLMDNLFAAKAKMANLIRRNCLDFIQNIPAEQAKKKSGLAKALKAFFISNSSPDLFELYGALTQNQKTDAILNSYKTRILGLFAQSLEEAAINYTAEEMSSLDSALQTIIKQALPHCAPEYEASNDIADLEVEVQKEVHKEVQTQQQLITQQYEPNLEESAYRAWPAIDTLYRHSLDDASITLNYLAQTNDLFSSRLRVSKNYARTHKQQTQYLDAFLKPAMITWYHLEDGVLHAMIITPEDVEELQSQIENTHGNWLSTTEGTVLAGTMPYLADDTNYQSLQEQVRFFNGEFTSFTNPEIPLSWINEKPLEKLVYFEERLLVYRPDAEQSFQEFKEILTHSNREGYDYIAEHAFEDLRDTDWLSLIPDALPTQILDYQRVTEAMYYISQKWQESILVLSALQKKFRLPLNSLSIVQDHLNHLKNLKSALRLCSTEFSNPFGFNAGHHSFTPGELNALEKTLTTPLAHFKKRLDEQYPPEISIHLAHFFLIRALQDKNMVTTRTLDVARSFTVRLCSSINDLLLILNNGLTDYRDIAAVIEKNSALHSDELVNALLKLPDVFTKPMLRSLLAQCTTEDQIIRLIAKKATDESLLLDLVGNKPPEKLALSSELQNETEWGTGVYTLVYKDSSTVLTRHSTADTVEFRMKTNASTALLATIIDHPCSTRFIYQAILNHANCTPELVDKIINRKGAYIEKSLVLEMAQVAYNRAVSEQSSQSDKEKWQPVALSAFTKALEIAEREPSYVNTKASVVAISMIGPKLEQNLDFSFPILSLFKSAAAAKLPLRAMIQAANPEQLSILLDYKNSAFLQANQLTELIAKCTTKPHIDHAIKRPDIVDSHRIQLLSNAALDESQLLIIAIHCNTQEVLEKAYCHPKANPNIKKAILEHPLCQTKTITSLLDALIMSEQDIIFLLSNTMMHPIITNELFNTITWNFATNNNVLIQIAAHPKATEELIDKILKHYLPQSAPLVHSILKKPGLIINPTLLKSIATHAFINLHKAPFIEIAQWEECIITVFNKSTAINARGTIINILKHRANRLTPKIALAAFREFTVDVLDFIPIDSLIKEYQPIEIVIDAVSKCTLTEQNLLKITEQCNNSEHITSLLGLKPFSPACCIRILEKDADLITDQHVATMLHNLTIHDKLNVDLIRGIIKLSMQRYSLSSHPQQWKELLVKGLRKANSMRISIELDTLMSSKEAINPKLGIELLEVLGTQLLEQLPLEPMIGIADQQQIYLFLEAPILCLLPQKACLKLLDRCHNEATLQLFLNRLNLDRESLVKVIQRHLNEPHLLLIMKQQFLDGELLEQLYTHPCATDTLQKSIIKHPVFSADTLACLVDKHALKAEHMMYLLQENHPSIEKAILKKSIPLFRDSVLLLKLSFKILQQFGEELLPYLSLKGMITGAQTHEIDQLISLKSIQKSDLLQLANKTLNEQQISKLLVHPEMTNSIAQTLFNKPQYNKIINNWHWLSEKQLLHILNESHDYASVHIALTHPNLCIKAREEWFKTVKFQHRQSLEQPNRSPAPQDKLVATLDKLKFKAYSHMLAALEHPEYQEVAKTAFTLYSNLINEYQKIARSSSVPIKQNTDTIEFRKKSISYIEQAIPILEQHRGYKKLLVDLLNVFLACSTLGVKYLTTGNWRFFEAKTKSLVLAEEIYENVMSCSSPALV
jgi:hypothetical protein